VNPPTHSQLCLRLRDRPSPSSEGDRDQRWSDHDHVAFSLSLFLFFFSLFLLLAPRPDSFEPPPPSSLSSTTFLSTPQSPDLVLHEGDLMESLGGSSLDEHRVWRFISASVSINHPTLRVDFSKLFLKSPFHTRIE
jgi:hypothetical protein